MEKINFEPIGKAMEAFDTDKMDIGRREEIENPDGTSGETEPTTPIYTNIPCHLSFEQLDYPSGNTVETRPVNKILKISCKVDIDLQNGDYITAYKLSSNGDIIETYIGIIGEPSTTMSRKTAEMQVRTNV